MFRYSHVSHARPYFIKKGDPISADLPKMEIQMNESPKSFQV